MQAFLKWFEAPPDMDLVLKAGLAHLWFVTIHPFDDGNGRIARAITEMALARSENSPQRFYSMSAHIRQERNDYYDILERTQAPWISGAAVMTYARVRCPEDERSPRRDPRYATLLDDEIPLTEYLKDTVARVLPYWDKTIAPAVKAGKHAISLGRPYSCS